MFHHHDIDQLHLFAAQTVQVIIVGSDIFDIRERFVNLQHHIVFDDDLSAGFVRIFGHLNGYLM